MGSKLVILVVLLGWGTSTEALAQRSAVVHAGPRTPWSELLRAELALVDLDLRVSDVPAPVSAQEAKALMQATSTTALVVPSEHPLVWVASCAGLRPRELQGSPGTTALLVAELIIASHSASCPELNEEEAWVLDPPEPADAALPLNSPPPSLELSQSRPAPAFGRFEAGLHLAAGHDFGGARPTWHGRLDAMVRLHRFVGITAGGTFPIKTAAIDRAEIRVELRTSTIELGARVMLPFPRIGRFELQTGPQAWNIWTRGYPRQARGTESRHWVPGWYGEAALHLDLHERVAFRLHTRVSGPIIEVRLRNNAVDAASGGAIVGRVGPQIHSGLGFVFAL